MGEKRAKDVVNSQKKLTTPCSCGEKFQSVVPSNQNLQHRRHPMKMIKPLVTAIAVFSAGHFALAKPQQKMDANNDGAVSVEEFKTFYAEVDRQTDKNGDGFVTTDEWSRQEMRHFAPNDTDKDGRLSMDEIMQMRLNHFKTMDKNGNGVLESEI